MPPSALRTSRHQEPVWLSMGRLRGEVNSTPAIEAFSRSIRRQSSQTCFEWIDAVSALDDLANAAITCGGMSAHNIYLVNHAAILYNQDGVDCIMN